MSYVSQYPPSQSDTYVKSTTKYSILYWAYYATDPSKSLIGTPWYNSWVTPTATRTNQRFHIDLGSAKIIERIYYENFHSSGAGTIYGAYNFTFWGSNSSSDFENLNYLNDGTWIQLPVSQTTFDQHIASDVADPKYILVTNVTGYRYYAFKFADCHGGNDLGVRRIELQTLVLPDIAQDVRLLMPRSGDISNDVRFDWLGRFKDVNQDIRIGLEPFFDVSQDIRFVDKYLIYEDVKQDIRTRNTEWASSNAIQDFRMRITYYKDLSEDIRLAALAMKDIAQNICIDKLYVKDFKCNCAPQKDSIKDFYGNLTSVSQSAVTVPANLIGTDMVKGDLISLDWDDDANYGYNIYRTSPLSRVKVNNLVIDENTYLVGNLIEDTTYKFVVVGVNGIGEESGDSNEVTVTPTSPDYSGGATRFQTFSYVVKINSVARSDVILQTIEIGYGSSPAVARFSIKKAPGTSGLPTFNDSVVCLVRGRTLFKGKILVRDEVGSNSETSVTYTAFSNITSYMDSCVDEQYIQQTRNNYYGLDVTDQTMLQAYETIANYQGNYRLYYDMNVGSLSIYALGSGYWSRNVIFDKNVIDWSLSENRSQLINSIKVIGGRTKTIVNFFGADFSTQVITSYANPGEQVNVEYVHTLTITGFNIADVQVEALASVGEPTIIYDPEVAIVPDDIAYGRIANKNTIPTYVLPKLIFIDPFRPAGTPKAEVFEDGTIEPKYKVVSYSNPPTEWGSAGATVDYKYTTIGSESYPIMATIILTSRPKIIRCRILSAKAVREGRVKEEDVDFGCVSYALPNIEEFSPLRVSYSYESESPISVTVGGGSPSRTITDSQYKIIYNRLEGWDNNSEVYAAINNRAHGELAKNRYPIITGRVKILGDETFNLKTIVSVRGNAYDVIRVTHDFTNGYTTEIELTNEKFRINLPTYIQERNRIDSERKTNKLSEIITQLQSKTNRPNQMVSIDQKVKKTGDAMPKSPFAIYGD